MRAAALVPSGPPSSEIIEGARLGYGRHTTTWFEAAATAGRLGSVFKGGPQARPLVHVLVLVLVLVHVHVHVDVGVLVLAMGIRSEVDWSRSSCGRSSTMSLAKERDEEGYLLDATIVRAHQDASGARKKGASSSSAARGGPSTKLHFQRIKRFRRIAMRFEKLARNSLAFVQLASVLVWLI